MQKWTIEEAQTVINSTGNQSSYPFSVQERVSVARIAAFLYRRQYKRQLQGASKRGQLALRAVNRRVDDIARKIIIDAKRAIGLKPAASCTPALLLSKRKDSILLDGLLPDREKRWVSLASRLKTQQIKHISISNFSFLSNPKETMNALTSIAEVEASCLSAQIDFLDQTCADIGPWLVLAKMRQDMAPIFSGGAISNQVSKVIEALRLKDQLRFNINPSWDGATDIWAFPLHTRRAAGTSTSPTYQIDPQAKEKAGDALSGAISEWLSTCADQELSDEGRRLVKKITGECLDNAERHSRREFENDGDWMLTGFMERLEDDQDGHSKFRCQLAFLSVGSPICETIQDCAETTLRDMNSYVASHIASFPNQRRPADHLRTIYSLQDMVTRDRDAFEQGRGGTGFRDIICFFWDLAGGEGDASISIVSGQTCLRIDHSYRDVVFPQPSETFNIWLNDANSQTEPPNYDMITELDSEFRGTLITMGFTLDIGYLESTIDGNR
jgi:hypothetical protein